MNCLNCAFCLAVKEWLYELFIVIRKNTDIRLHRWATLTGEMLAPVVIIAIVVRVNTHVSLFRARDLEQLTAFVIKNQNKSLLESFYDLGRDYSEEVIVNYNLCSNRTDLETDPCLIGYVVKDEETERAIFMNNLFINFFSPRTHFVKFVNEEALETCVKAPGDCAEFEPYSSSTEAMSRRDMLFNFRGAVVFNTGITAKEVKYKIRLLERYYGSLRHVIKTSTLTPSLHDDQAFIKSYINSGFLGLQYVVDRMIITYVKGETGDTFIYERGCQCNLQLHEMPHRTDKSSTDIVIDEHGPSILSYYMNANMNVESEDEVNEEEHHNLFEVHEDVDHSRVVKSGVTVTIILVLSFTFLIPSEQRRIVTEKQQGLTILLLITGMTHRTQWIGNLIACAVNYCIPITIIVILATLKFNLKEGALFETTDGFLLWVLFFLYVMAIASASYFLTIFFDQAVQAIAGSSCILVLSYLAPVYHFELIYDTAPLFAKLFVCLHPSFALQTALKILIRFENLGVRTNILKIGQEIPTDSMRLIYVVIMLIFDTVLFMSLTLYLDRVVKSKWGVFKPWYYIFKPSEWGSGKSSVNQVAPAPDPIMTTPKKSVGAATLSNPDGVDVDNASVNVTKSAISVATTKSKTKSVKKKKSELKVVTGKSRRKLKVSPGEEEESAAMAHTPSIITEKLTKKYKNVVALDNLDIKFYHGEIFVLLGPNGSGKTTLTNILSGYTEPSSGTAKIYGYDIKSHMIQIQEFTGMCTQNNALYEDLTALEQLLIFGRLRGLRGKEALEESLEVLEKLHILEVRNVTTRKLSSGDKRKLSLAIAVIGNPKIIILDAPTRGMDYYSRRAVWDLLLKIRASHTIIMSTQFMDEAELLGDRIGIMVRGKMEVCGNAAFLREQFGLGYSLKLKMAADRIPDKAVADLFLKVVQKSMPSATINSFPVSPNAHRLVSFNLPEEGYSSDAMSILFEDLEAIRKPMGIRGFYVSHASIDEVFMALSFKLNPEAQVVTPMNDDAVDEDQNANLSIVHDSTRQFFLPFLRFWTLLLKKAKYFYRKRVFSCFQLCFPTIIMFIALIRLTSHITLDGRSGPPLEITLENYPTAVTLYHGATRFDNALLKEVIGKSSKHTENPNIASVIINLNNPYSLRTNYIAGVRIDSGKTKRNNVSMYVSMYKLHAAPLAVNLYANILLHKMDKTRDIKVISHPLQHPYFEGPYLAEDSHASDSFAMLGCVSITIVLAFMMIFPLEENLSDTKHLQMMSGLSSLVYWMAIFVWDIGVAFACVFIVVSFSFVYPTVVPISKYTFKDKIVESTCQICGAYGYCGMFFFYTFSQFAHSVSGGFALVIAMIFLCGIMLPFLTVSIEGGLANDEGLSWVLRLIPIYSLSISLRKWATSVLENAVCNHFSEEGEKHFCSVDRNPKLNYSVSCCRNCADIPGGVDCQNREVLLVTPWSHFFRSYEEKLVELTEFHEEDPNHRKELLEHSIFYELVCLVCVGFFFNMLVIFLDSDAWQYLTACVISLKGRAFQTDVEDDDVQDEAERVQQLVKSERINEDALISHKLCKTYGIFPALHDINFGVHPGECFGVLGVNGAGKTTLIRLGVGATTETFGNVYCVDCSLTHHRRWYMQKIGFSPHHSNAVFDYLTPRENLKVFAQLRSLTPKKAKQEIQEILTVMNLIDCADKVIKTLDQGIKRRVSVGIAIIAKPPIIFFDEPTSDADPADRRHYWETIKGLRKAGHTIVFNSHRIIECEALCDRVAVLIDGKFQCIGSPTHLKDKLGRGYKLIIKLIPGPADNQGYVSSLSETIIRIFNPCSLRDRRRNVVQYVIHNAQIPWDFLYKNMAVIKVRYNDLVEDYTFSETTLEEVFLSLVILQHCGRVPDTSGCSC